MKTLIGVAASPRDLWAAKSATLVEVRALLAVFSRLERKSDSDHSRVDE